MNTKDRPALAERKRHIAARLDPRSLPKSVSLPPEFRRRSFSATKRGNATSYGGVAIGAQLIEALGLREEIDSCRPLLRRHRPYTEADHVISLAMAAFCGARSLDDIDKFREDEAFLDAIGMQRMPDPTTSGDFLRRFSEENVFLLMEAINRVRMRCWEFLPASQKKLAKIDVDATLVDTYGECKEGTDFNYKRGFGYAPLVVSLANTKEPLYIRNQPGSRPSHDGFLVEAEAAIETVTEGGFERARLRGDRAFAVTQHFDDWTDRGVEFVFSSTTYSNVATELDSLPKTAWKKLKRKRREVSPERRRKRPTNVKRERVKERGYRTLTLETEDYVEIPYRPARCSHDYRLVAVRKTITVTEGQLELEDEVRYFCYLTNVPSKELSSRQVIAESNHRCDQENLIEQMKNGVPSMTAPVGCLTSNWAWMVITALPLSMKAWLSILHPDREARGQLRRMQYRRFLRTIVQITVQPVKQARGLTLKIQEYTRNAALLIDGLSHLRRLSPCASSP